MQITRFKFTLFCSATVSFWFAFYSSTCCDASGILLNLACFLIVVIKVEVMVFKVVLEVLMVLMVLLEMVLLAVLLVLMVLLELVLVLVLMNLDRLVPQERFGY